MKKIIDNLLASLNNKQGEGYSGKKITALAVTIAYCVSHRLATPEQLASVLTVDAALIATLFGINTYDKKLNKDESNANKQEGN